MEKTLTIFPPLIPAEMTPIENILATLRAAWKLNSEKSRNQNFCQTFAIINIEENFIFSVLLQIYIVLLNVHDTSMHAMQIHHTSALLTRCSNGPSFSISNSGAPIQQIRLDRGDFRELSLQFLQLFQIFVTTVAPASWNFCTMALPRPFTD